MAHGWKRTAWLLVAVVTTTAGCQSLCRDSSGPGCPLFRKPLPIAYWFVNPAKACCIKKQPTLGRYWDVFDAWYVKDRARKCGMAAIKRMVKQTGCVPSVDYRRGFVQAYIDIAMGSDGQLPPVPPQDYWGAFGRTRTGHQRAAEWFRGYADGVQQAQSCDLEHIGTVPTSVSADGAGSEAWPPEHSACPDGHCEHGLTGAGLDDAFGYSGAGLSGTAAAAPAGSGGDAGGAVAPSTAPSHMPAMTAIDVGSAGGLPPLSGAGYAALPGSTASTGGGITAPVATAGPQPRWPATYGPPVAGSGGYSGMPAAGLPAVSDGPAYGAAATVTSAEQSQMEVPPFGDQSPGSGISRMSYQRPAGGEGTGNAVSAATEPSPPLWPYAPQAQGR